MAELCILFKSNLLLQSLLSPDTAEHRGGTVCAGPWTGCRLLARLLSIRQESLRHKQNDLGIGELPDTEMAKNESSRDLFPQLPRAWGEKKKGDKRHSVV